MPARDEEEALPTTLPALLGQEPDLRVVLVDDRSSDGTAERARALGGSRVTVVAGTPTPPAWSGKVWALAQGWGEIDTPLVLLADADVELRFGLLAALRERRDSEGVQLVSLVARPEMSGWWERLLMPAFVYYFKLLYPFRLSNRPGGRVAAAAGGCVLVERSWVDSFGGFAAIRGELIDDCALARALKAAGGRTWIGLTRSARSVRPYGGLGGVWNMVARHAFTQLGHSVGRLLACSLLLALAYWVPVAGLFSGGPAAGLSAVALGVMVTTYAPTLRYYGRSPAWALLLPVISTLYLAMTWTSAVRHWRGTGGRWKGRSLSGLAARST